MKSKIVSSIVTAGLCGIIASTSFAQSVGVPTTNARMIRAVPPVIAKPPLVTLPKGGVQNWVAVAAVATAVVAVGTVVHHAKESWFPGIRTPIRVINPASSALFDAPATRL
jgi:hypothetical protein